MLGVWDRDVVLLQQISEGLSKEERLNYARDSNGSIKFLS